MSEVTGKSGMDLWTEAPFNLLSQASRHGVRRPALLAASAFQGVGDLSAKMNATAFMRAMAGKQDSRPWLVR